MKQFPIVVRFDNAYFDKKENLIINGRKLSEAMRKKNRPYASVAGTLVSDRDNTYFVPFRSHLNKQN
ncbi:hypothetical protein GTO87_04765 [Ligilactobacillus saerimneri]|uniref:Uncharacterized protein n=1 Tax=Ligilactobacillus saerimneri TaxID=228229 RepID=A0A7H9EJV2_9LACO|nr:hypothetical protein [Ligilactobacillus saerimneri]MBU5309161.1 hypothetical protein [Ligilactobacillus saerimneri]QLL77980.1 hypothetical protein GTO87_04765 [Ligilactobacillus saerimneri]